MEKQIMEKQVYFYKKKHEIPSILPEFIERNKGKVCGIMQGPTIDKLRYVTDIGTGETMRLQISKEDLEKLPQPHQVACDYYMLDSSFEWINQRLLRAMDSPGPAKYLVIDTLGAIEMEGKGYEPALSKIMSKRSEISNMKIILTFRESYTERFSKKFNLSAEEVGDFDEIF